MPRAELSGEVFRLSGGAGFDWGLASARSDVFGVLTLDLTAEACHGIDLSAAADARAQLELVLALLAQVRGEGAALARAGASLRISLKPDLFDRFGLTVEASAYAEAALAVSLGLGLDMGAIVELASEGLSGPSSDLCLVFLESIDLEAGAWARLSASAAASAYLNVSGRLTGENPGFAIEGGAAAGLLAGGGYDFYARAGIKDVQRMVARAADVVARAALAEFRARVPNAALPAVEAADLLVPFAVRACLELGRAQGLQQLGNRPEVLETFVASFLAEFQRFVLDRATLAVTRCLRELLDSSVLRIPPAALDPGVREAALQAARRLQQVLSGQTADPDLAVQIVDGLLACLGALGPFASSDMRRLVALLWSCSVLGLGARGLLERAGLSLSGSASLVGLGGVAGRAESFSLPAAPAGVRSEIATALSLPAGTALIPEHVFRYVRAAGLEPLLLRLAPEAATAMHQIRRVLGLDPADFLSVLLPGAGDGPVVGSAPYVGLRAWVADQLDGAVLGQLVDPAVDAARTAGDDAAAEFLDTVVRPLCVGMRDVLLEALDSVASGNPLSADFSAACSGIVYRVVAPGLATLASLLGGFVGDSAAAGLEGVADRLRGSEGAGIAAAAVPVFAPVLPQGQALPAVAEATRRLLIELCEISAETVGPGISTPDRRRRSRELMTGMLLSVDGDVDWTSRGSAQDGLRQLAECAYVPNVELLKEYFALSADVLGEQCDVLVRRIPGALSRFYAALATAAVESAVAALTAALTTLDAALEDLAERIDDLRAEADRLLNQAERLLRDAGTALSTAAARMRSRATTDNLFDELRRSVRQLVRAGSPPGTPAGLIETGAATAMLAFDNPPARALLQRVLDVAADLADVLGATAAGAADVAAVLRRLTQQLTEALVGPLRDFDVAGLGPDDLVSAMVATLATPEWRSAIQQHLSLLIDREETVRRRVVVLAKQRTTVDKRKSMQADRAALGKSGTCRIAVASPPAYTGREGGVADSRTLTLDLAVSGSVDDAFFQQGRQRRLLLYLNAVALNYAPGDWERDATERCTYAKQLPVSALPLRIGLNCLEVVVTQPNGAESIRHSVTFLYAPADGDGRAGTGPGNWTPSPRITRIRIPAGR